MSHHFVEFTGVSFSYPDGTPALNDISFRVVHGEAVGIIGANGAGKSTLLLHLNGSLLASGGQINVGGTPVTAQTLLQIRRHVGLIFQNADDQLFMPTVYDDVAFGPRNLGLAEPAVEQKVKQALEAVGATVLGPKPPHHLSGGEKSAVAIAGVLAMEPDVLVMDEPAANLDPKSRRRLIGQLQGFKHTRLIAAHDLDLIWDVCSRCLVMKEGRIVADGPAQEILKDQALLESNHLELPLRFQGSENATVFFNK